MQWRLLTGLVPAILAFSGPVQADIYAFVDGNGIRHLSNIPNDTRYKLVMRTPAYRKEAAQTASSFAPTNLYGSSGIWNNSQRTYSRASKTSSRPLRVNEQNRQRFAADVSRIATQHGLDPALMHAVISAESSYNPWAVSPKGAMGLMQLMPGTAERFGVSNPYDPIANMHGGARYLRWLLNQFNDTRLAVAAYNAGEGAVQKYGNQIPPYPETQTYVTRVMSFHQQYKGGDLYNTAYGTGTAGGSPLAYNSYTTANTGRSNGVTIITPRAYTPQASTGSATIPRTYLTPTGTRIIVGASGGAGNTNTGRPAVVYSVKPNQRASSSPSGTTLFAGNDK